jgi:cobalt-zinc-cadmium efflux system outer membrane protein
MLAGHQHMLGMQTPTEQQQQQMPGMQMPPGQQMPRMQPAPATTTPPAKQPAGPALRLEELEQMALKNNPTLAQAEAEIRAAAGRKQQAGLYPNPTIGFDADEVSGGPVIRGGQVPGFFVQQDIVLGGKLGLSRRVFEQERRQSEVERDEQRLRVLNSVRLFFFQALAAQRTVELDRQLLQVTRDAVETSKQLLNVGQADEPDVLQSQVEAQRQEIALIAAEQNLQRASRSLAASIGRPDLQPARLEGNLEEVPLVDTEQWLESMLRDSPAVKIAELGVARAEAVLARARRQPIPDLQLRGGLRRNRELLEATGRPIGLQGFAEVGVQVPIFNRNQGNVQAAQADLERAKQEVRRVKLLLRERSASFSQSYLTARAAAERYRTQMIPWATEAYQLYLKKYQNMQAAYPQVLVSQRTLFQLQTDYITALEIVWTNSVALRGFLLTDGLEAPAKPGELDRPVREINMPSARISSSQER